MLEPILGHSLNFKLQPDYIITSCTWLDEVWRGYPQDHRNTGREKRHILYTYVYMYTVYSICLFFPLLSLRSFYSRGFCFNSSITALVIPRFTVREMCRLPPCVVVLAWKQRWHCDVYWNFFTPVPTLPQWGRPHSLPPPLTPKRKVVVVERFF